MKTLRQALKRYFWIGYLFALGCLSLSSNAAEPPVWISTLLRESGKNIFTATEQKAELIARRLDHLSKPFQNLIHA